MNTLKIDKHIKIKYDKLPKGWVFYALESDHGYLTCGYSANLKRRFKAIQSKADEGGVYGEMWHRVTGLCWQKHETGVDALVHYKCSLSQYYPEYQAQTMPWSAYAYLALDAYSFPFISITDNTQGEAMYLGPFRSRFFVADLIDIYARILKLPQCETSNFPCDKYHKGSCQGWCLALKDNPAETGKADLEKLDSLLKEAFLHPENGILELVSNQKDAYFNELEFTKASLLEDEAELLSQYRDWLKFLYVAKQLEIDTPELQVQKGRISRCRFEDKDYHFPVDNTTYRKNESLAMDLAYVDESRIIYDYLMAREK